MRDDGSPEFLSDVAESERRRRRRVVGLIRASHFQPTLAVTGFTTALAIGDKRRWGAAAVGSAVLAGQLCVGWSNDFLDRDRDRDANRLDKPIVAGDVTAATVRNGAVVAAIACVPLSLASGKRAGAAHLAALGSAIAYNARLKRTVLSVVPYIVAFGSLPAFVSMGGAIPRRPAPAATLAAALMGAGAHFVNTLPDLADDVSGGVVGLPHRLGETGSLLTGAALLGVASAVVAHSGHTPLTALSRSLAIGAETSVLGVLVAAATGRQRAAWTLSLATAATTVALFLSRGDAMR
ncbi:MAG: UbiA family prenyltransferase [Ilumatobacteraceae bacterium]